MAVISITVPDEILPRLRDGFALATGYQAEMPNPAFDPMQPVSPENPEHIANPITKVQWVRAQVIDYVKRKAAEGELMAFDEQQRADRLAQAQSIEADIVVT